jgi:hypothetical protein
MKKPSLKNSKKLKQWASNRKSAMRFRMSCNCDGECPANVRRGDGVTELMARDSSRVLPER